MIQNECATSRDSMSICTFLSDRQVQHRESVLVDRAVAVEALLRLDARRVDVLVDVVEVPRPALAEDLDLHVGVARVALDLLLVTRREGEEADDQDERHDRVEDLDRQVVAQLHREADLALAAAVDDRGPDDEAPGDDADAEEDDPRGDPEADDALRCGSCAGLGREGSRSAAGLRAAGEHDRDDEADREHRPASQ